MPFGMWVGVGDSHHVLYGSPYPPRERGNFGVGKGPSHSKVHVSREEMAGSIEMAFGVWGAVGPSNHVLDGGPHLPMVRGNFFWGGGFPLH